MESGQRAGCEFSPSVRCEFVRYVARRRLCGRRRRIHRFEMRNLVREAGTYPIADRQRGCAAPHRADLLVELDEADRERCGWVIPSTGRLMDDRDRGDRADSVAGQAVDLVVSAARATFPGQVTSSVASSASAVEDPGDASGPVGVRGGLARKL